MHPNLLSDWLEKHWLIVLVILSLVGLGLRATHHSEWLIFQSDQSRDAFIINEAREKGFGSLPLLGPQARGSELHLGPVFYYFQYISSSIFGQRPESLAYPDLLFGVLTVPLIFFVLRLFLSPAVSLYMTALASTSLFLVTFSRFAWNPNSLPFFTTLFAFSFLSSLESVGKKRWALLVIAAASLGIIANLHFVPAIGLMIGLTFFLILSRPLRLKEILFCAGIFLLFQVPTIVNEIRTKGDTTRSFIETVSEKNTKDDRHNAVEKVVRASQETSRAVWIVATGQQNTDFILTRGFSIHCDKKCRSALPYSLAALALTGAMLFSSFLFFLRAKDPLTRKKLLFLFSWAGGFFLVTVLIAYQVSTRFFLGIIPVVFIFLGIILAHLYSLFKSNLWKSVLLGAGIILLGLNFLTTSRYLSELSASQISPEESGKDLVFGTEHKVTLGQLRKLADTTRERLGTGRPVVISGESRYVRSFYYLLSVENGLTGCYFKGGKENSVASYQARIVKNKQERGSGLPQWEYHASFGTLALELFSSGELSPDNERPAGCLTN